MPARPSAANASALAPSPGASEVGADFVFVETSAQVRGLASTTGQRARDVVVAVTPAAALACQLAGVAYARLDDFVGTTNHRSGFETAVLDLVAWTAWLDGWARERIPPFAATAFRPAQAASFRFLRLHGEIWGSGHIVAELLDRARPGSITLWGAQSPSVAGDLESRYDPTVALLIDAARERGIAVHDRGTVDAGAPTVPDAAPGSVGLMTRVRNRVLEGRLRPIAAAARGGGIADALRAILPRARSTPHVLACGFGYDVQRLVVELRREGVHATQISKQLRDRPVDRQIAAAVAASVTDLLASPELWRPLDPAAIARPRMWAAAVERWWLDVVPRLWANFPDAVAAVRGPVDAVLLSDVGSASFGGLVQQAAASVGVPTYVYQHGGSADLDTPTLLPWATVPDGLLVYGEGTAAELAETAPEGLPRVARIHAVGSTRLDEIQAKGAPRRAPRLRRTLQGGDDRPLVLYVPTHFAPHFRAVGQLADLPTVRYFELLQRILGVFADAHGVRLVFKAFGVANDTTAIIPDLVRRTVTDAVVTEMPIRELMWSVDAIVADHVITAATELLLTDAPCVFYMPAQTPRAQRARVLLRRAATVAETPDAFAEAVRSLVTSESIAAVRGRDREFLRAYGTFRDDGCSAQRAARAVMGGSALGPRRGVE